MTTQTFEPSDFDKLFSAKAEANPQHAEVGENLSGQVQLLKSADSSLVQKNLQGNTIEENILIEKAQHQTIQTNQTDAYEPGVNTNLTEVAPSIHIQQTLTEGIIQTTAQQNLNVTTQDERETYHQPNVERYHQSLQSNMPTELDQTIQTSGQSTVDQQQSDTKKHTVNSTHYTQSFDTFDHAGPIQISQNANIGSASLIIGGAPDVSGIDFTLRQGIQEAIPKIATKIVGKSLALPPIITPLFMITGTLELTGNLMAKGLNPVPVTVDKDGINVDLQNRIDDYFAGLSFKSISDFSSPISAPPTIEVGNENGNMEFSNGAQFEVIGSSVKVVYHSGFTINESNYEGWQLSSNGSATLTVWVTPITPMYRIEKSINVKFSRFQEALSSIVQKARSTVSTIPTPSPQDVAKVLGGISLTILAFILIPVGA